LDESFFQKWILGTIGSASRRQQDPFQYRTHLGSFLVQVLLLSSSLNLAIFVPSMATNGKASSGIGLLRANEE